MTRKETTANGVTIVECRYDSGLVEISAYIDPVLPKAGRILVGVATRQDPKCKWCAYMAGGGVRPAFKSRLKIRATEAIRSWAMAAKLKAV